MGPPRRSQAVATCMFLAIGCNEGPSVARAPVVYGTDDRAEVYEHASAVHRAIAETAVAMQLGNESIDAGDPSNVRVTYTQTLGEAHSLCADVPYADQIEPGTCSGTLIDERHVLTAGHCVSDVASCDGVRYPWVFGFHYQAAGVLRTLRADDVYHCVRAVTLRDDESGDYAVIELDRAVEGHVPARVRRSPAPLGTALTMIGHPNGIPMKIAGNAEIRSSIGVEIQADLDAFFGNSGSGVFDDAGEVVGIPVGGAPDDFQPRAGAGCSEIVVLDPLPETQEQVIAVSAPLDAFCAVPGVVSPLCEGAGADAGAAPADAGGAAPADAGAAPADAGMTSDGAAFVEDASVAIGDAAALDGGGVPVRGSGCGCRAISPSRSPSRMLALGAIASVLLLRRRRTLDSRRRCSPSDP